MLRARDWVGKNVVCRKMRPIVLCYSNGFGQGFVSVTVKKTSVDIGGDVLFYSDSSAAGT